MATLGGVEGRAPGGKTEQGPNPSYQGLRHIPGRGPYPVVDSMFARGFGVGVRHRGAAAVCQIKASGSYAAPQIVT